MDPRIADQHRLGVISPLHAGVQGYPKGEHLYSPKQ
jgi:hypothetical protein